LQKVLSYCKWWYCLCVIVLSNCSSPSEDYSIAYPFGFDSIPFPKDNALTKSRVELGRRIFFDPSFSADGKISCGTCHKPELAFADTVAINRGAHDSSNFRNSPSLINIAYHPYLDMDGGVPSLELQVLVPFDGPTEMNSNHLKAAEIMNKNKDYVELSLKAYNRKPDPFVIVRALGAFQRALISSGSRYDLYMQSGRKKGLNQLEIQGMNLFFSDKTNCSSCHEGVLFTNFKFENIGLPNTTRDTGRARVTLNPLDVGKFKTPSLRNVAKTKPYMHDGSLKTLEEVIEFYDKGGVTTRNKSEKIRPLHLSKKEKTALVAFLKSLSDTTQ